MQDHDPAYFPGTEDDFTPSPAMAAPATGDSWDGYRYEDCTIEDAPTIDLAWYEDRFGTMAEAWDLFNERGRLVMKIVRFMDKTGGKNDRPFTVWANTGRRRWRCKAMEAPYPLYNLKDLIDRPNDPILLTEGQKAASRARTVMQGYVCVGWYGGVNSIEKNDFTPMRGRSVYFWPDADQAGREVIKKLKDLDLDLDLKIVHAPTGVKKGWDIADAIESGWTVADLEDLIMKTDEVKQFADDGDAFPFKVLGRRGDEVAFYSFKSHTIIYTKASSVTKGALMNLADRQVWGLYYRNDSGGIAWDAAVNDLLRRADTQTVFEPGRIRGAGAWYDKGEIIISTGEKLFINGREYALHEKNGAYVYEKTRPVPYQVSGGCSTDEAARLFELLQEISFKEPSSYLLLAGWLTLAPWCGVLKWRPHLWVTGPAGSGKSWVLDKVALPMAASPFGVKASGASTPAGLRQALGHNSLCLVADEFESDNQKMESYIEQNLKLLRECSSGRELGEGMNILHGSSDGEGMQWHIQTMAMVASIGAAIKHGADAERFTNITMKTLDHAPEKQRERLAFLEQKRTFLTPAWVTAYHARTASILAEVLACVEVFTEQVAALTGNRRQGDQLGTLLAGAWMISHDVRATAAEASAWAASLNLDTMKVEDEKRQTEVKLYDELMNAAVEITDGHSRNKQTIAYCVEWCLNEDRESALKRNVPLMGASREGVRKELERWGIKPMRRHDEFVAIAKAHPAIRRILKDTGWSQTYDEILTRLPGCDGKLHGPTEFAGIKKRYILVRWECLDDIPF